MRQQPSPTHGTVKRRLSWTCLLMALFSVLPDTTRAQPVERADLRVDTAYASLILNELERHPLMELQDLYKFVHQSAMGPGHAVHDTTGVRNWMEREIAEMNTRPDLNEPKIALLRPDSALVRVNLRPFLEGGGDPEAVLRAFIDTANQYKPSVDQFRHYWSIVVELARSGEIPIDPDSARALVETMAESGFPAVHHTRSYSEAYQPAYRVVQRSLIPK